MGITFTKNQNLILEEFFHNTDKAYYLQELGKVLGKKVGVFQRDINKLVENGILEDYHRGNNRFFKLNKIHPLFPEFKNIFLKTTGVVGLLEKELTNIDGIEKAFIYGSIASGKEDLNSDVDLFVVGEADEMVLINIVNDIEKRIGREINYILISEEEFERKISEKNSFILNVLNNKIIKLIWKN